MLSPRRISGECCPGVQDLGTRFEKVFEVKSDAIAFHIYGRLRDYDVFGQDLFLVIIIAKIP